MTALARLIALDRLRDFGVKDASLTSLAILLFLTLQIVPERLSNSRESTRTLDAAIEEGLKVGLATNDQLSFEESTAVESLVEDAEADVGLVERDGQLTAFFVPSRTQSVDALARLRIALSEGDRPLVISTTLMPVDDREADSRRAGASLLALGTSLVMLLVQGGAWSTLSRSGRLAETVLVQPVARSQVVGGVALGLLPAASVQSLFAAVAIAMMLIAPGLGAALPISVLSDVIPILVVTMLALVPAAVIVAATQLFLGGSNARGQLSGSAVGFVVFMGGFIIASGSDGAVDAVAKVPVLSSVAFAHDALIDGFDLAASVQPLIRSWAGLAVLLVVGQRLAQRPTAIQRG